MTVHERAGTPARPEDLVDVPALLAAYRDVHPDPKVDVQRVAFGTSGHRGSARTATFNDDHIAATSQAIVEYRAAQGIDGPLFLGRDSHALSEPALRTAAEVFTANDVTLVVDSRDGLTPTPALSHAILVANAGPGGRAGGAGSGRLADGVVVTPSHNPPADGGFKYNPPDGGPAGTEATTWIADRANELLEAGLAGVRRSSTIDPGRYDFLGEYVAQLDQVLDMDAIRDAGVRIGADPLGGASVDYWGVIAERYGLDLTVVNPDVDPAFGFMTLDWDGKIRMDCSSPYAMASLIARMEPGSADASSADAPRGAPYRIATGNDADADRHGIVTADGGLMNPNHYLAVAIGYLYAHRPGWPAVAGIGKTAVSSSMIDRVAADLGRPLVEVPVGFKWFVPGLRSGEIGFGGEESAGASFLRRDGSPWTTDKDGLLLALLASEITATTGRTPSEHYRDLTARFGEPAYARTDVACSREEKAALGKLDADAVTATELAGDPITAKLTRAPGNDAPIGGLKVVTDSGWFAARPSGTEDVYKVYAESFRGPEHLARIQDQARDVVSAALAG
ncbi:MULTISPECIES: phosphoglucomutase (alpha-D-glucose-1,6-bisphosphate-dependent) [Pseudonocardia]|uniref:Phosphoglucomutase n=2 Tax=Pseudonocardia TaxID=1847 RepID=A0A1Y2N7W3_PSEAH|nr:MULTISPECIES: phosphoglucomutase (alpha-D-glucose-1,6-bisphosphate-dependent) [Pseudonocardia]OSY43167.1 Phosphoglucomutase [Pseudonocardia autotrophica]TDN71655.1 phosphoglucomutase [Pseudonocardia autotrophica]BBG02342.1 phosphoglucomutase, alpha-D-glucose phosphate-specific [Pseudonocardia autotrophica]GEC23322.1 phosphoglucomutase, alpha-D-glucose phosphate-specific [Pseudonocardia saturnea]